MTTTTTTTSRRAAAVVLGIGVLLACGAWQGDLGGTDGARASGVPRGLATEQSAAREQPVEDRLAIASGSRLVAAVLDFTARHPGKPLPTALVTPEFAAGQARALVEARQEGTRFSGSDRLVDAVAPVSITYSPKGTAVVMSACLEKHTSVTRGGTEVRRGPDGLAVRQGQRLATLYDVAVHDGAALLTGMRSGDRC